MVRLTREVRFTIPLPPAGVAPPINGLSGNLVDGPAIYFVVQVTLDGEIHPQSQYVENIKVIDGRVRRDVVPAIARLLQDARFTLARATQQTSTTLSGGWSNGHLHGVRLAVNPCLHCTVLAENPTMIRLTQRFEFSAAHRLHNPALDEVTNRSVFGKCNNPAGHGHNYEFEVTISGTPDENGRLIDLDAFARIVQKHVIDRFDHKHLNRQTSDFATVIPSVENIARVIHELLEPHFAPPAKLAMVQVWETPKTSACYGR